MEDESSCSLSDSIVEDNPDDDIVGRRVRSTRRRLNDIFNDCSSDESEDTCSNTYDDCSSSEDYEPTCSKTKGKAAKKRKQGATKTGKAAKKRKQGATKTGKAAKKRKGEATKKGKEACAVKKGKEKAATKGKGKAAKEKKDDTKQDGTKVKRKMLKRTEMSDVIESIKGITLDVISSKVEVRLKEQISCNYQVVQQHLDDLLQNTSLFRSLVNHHHKAFIDKYELCCKGKEKHLRFQLMWHNHCSVFLLPKHLDIHRVLPDVDKKSEHHICDLRRSWIEFCESYSPNAMELCKRLMILLSSAIYDILLKEVHSHDHMIASSAATSTLHTDIDGNDVYFRFGGAALSEMFQLRYKNMSMHHKNSTSQEIAILQAINTKEKSSMPEYLKYRDRGFMYSPHPTFIPFIRDVDNCVREVVNPTGFQEHAGDLIKVVHSLVKKRTILKDAFVNLLRKRIPEENDLGTSAIDNVYDDMVRKLCNTRIQEFLSSQKQSFAIQKGRASTAGQNLRDTLLSQHTNLQSHVKI